MDHLENVYGPSSHKGWIVGVVENTKLGWIPNYFSSIPNPFKKRATQFCWSSWKCILVTALGPWSHLVPPAAVSLTAKPAHTILHFWLFSRFLWGMLNIAAGGKKQKKTKRQKDKKTKRQKDKKRDKNKQTTKYLTWWPNFKLKQVLPPGCQIFN